MLVFGITIVIIAAITVGYYAWVEHLKKRSPHMEVIVTTFSPFQVLLNSIWPGLAIILLVKSFEPAQLTPNQNLAALFFVGPATLWMAYLSWSLAENSAMKSLNIVLWMVSVQSCFWMFAYWGGGTAFYDGHMSKWDNDHIWAFATIGYDFQENTYNPEAWASPLLYFKWLLGINFASVLISLMTFGASSERLMCSVLQALGIYQVLIIIAMITDNPYVLLALDDMIGGNARTYMTSEQQKKEIRQKKDNDKFRQDINSMVAFARYHRDELKRLALDKKNINKTYLNKIVSRNEEFIKIYEDKLFQSLPIIKNEYDDAYIAWRWIENEIKNLK